MLSKGYCTTVVMVMSVLRMLQCRCVACMLSVTETMCVLIVTLSVRTATVAAPSASPSSPAFVVGNILCYCCNSHLLVLVLWCILILKWCHIGVCVARAVPLGRVCTADDVCADENAMCLSGVCQCSAGFQNIKNICSTHTLCFNVLMYMCSTHYN